MSKTVEVPEYPIATSVAIEPARTALLVIDMQNDFVDEKGSLAVPGAAATVPVIRRIIDWARRTGIAVMYTQDTHLAGDPEWAIWPKHVERGTWGWEFAGALKPAPGELVFEKARYDGFYGTSLDHELRRRGIDTLVICGTVASICVHYTAASAALRWYRVVHPIDALSALTPFDMESALRQASFLFQAVLTTSEGLIGGLTGIESVNRSV